MLVISIIDNLTGFFKTLSGVDYVLYFAILVLVVLIVSLIYLLNTTDVDDDLLELEDFNNDSLGEFDIKEAVSKLVEDKNNSNTIDLTEYEKEQEEKAIISYDELINSTKNKKINYESDELLNNTISVRKVNLENLTSDVEEEKTNVNVKVISYQHEEEFLRALKQLQKLLN